MTLQGPELAIGRLHPEFAVRLEHAIREARSAGLSSAGVFSAYRPPAFGVGGFSDKFNSLHTYGLAVDMRGIGSPGSPEAQLWHQIAAKNGVVCPYGPGARTEWNHCQPTSVRIILAENPLRDTVSSAGMFEAGNSSRIRRAQPIRCPGRRYALLLPRTLSQPRRLWPAAKQSEIRVKPINRWVTRS
jgi:hypothetical protein